MILNWKEHTKERFYNGGWVKKVTGVDMSKSNGYCFDGQFVSGAANNRLTECEDGYYIVCDIGGSRKNQRKNVAVFKIAGEEVTQVVDWVEGRDWALQIREKVAELLDEKPNPLAGYSTEDLLAELRSRGVEC